MTGVSRTPQATTADAPALAGLPDGSVYLAGADGLWHRIPNSATFASLGLDANTITWYGELPGDVGDPLPSA